MTTYPGPLLDIPQYWNGYPHDCISAVTKFYYLSQTAYWFQQMISLQLEKHRKDHVQMFSRELPHRSSHYSGLTASSKTIS